MSTPYGNSDLLKLNKKVKVYLHDRKTNQNGVSQRGWRLSEAFSCCQHWYAGVCVEREPKPEVTWIDSSPWTKMLFSLSSQSAGRLRPFLAKAGKQSGEQEMRDLQGSHTAFPTLSHHPVLLSVILRLSLNGQTLKCFFSINWKTLVAKSSSWSFFLQTEERVVGPFPSLYIL